MKKSILGFFTALIIATAAFAVSPDGEIWKYTLQLNENYSVNYAYRDGETYLEQCQAEKCLYYKVPCTLYPSGFVCGVYFPNFAIAMQKIGTSWGFMSSMCPFGKAVEIAGIGITPYLFMFNLDLVGSTDEIPDEDFIELPEQAIYYIPPPAEIIGGIVK